MKNIFRIIVLLFIIGCKAQTVVNLNTYNIGDNSNKYFKDLDNNFDNFVGTWETTTDNKTFRVILWKEIKNPLNNEVNSYIDDLLGKFLTIENADLPNEIILHNSVKYFPINNATATRSLIGNPYMPNRFVSYFVDTCANGGNGVLEGSVEMIITNPGNVPLTAQWTVKSTLPLKPGEYFSVPLNTILTKVN